MLAGFDESDVRELFELRCALEPLGVDRLVKADGAVSPI
jgi:DNA-binding GntR family transcriptional regulator